MNARRYEHPDIDESQDEAQRRRLSRRMDNWLETPMFLLSLLWVALLAVELVWGDTSWEWLVTTIWVIFVAEFVLRFSLAPRKLEFLQYNWLTLLALALPALRVFRVARVVYLLRVGRAVRGLTLARLLTAFNRGFATLRRSLGRFGFGYILALTLLVTCLASAGMYAFEREAAGGGLQSFGDALWFTAMLMTTSGSDYWPRTNEGRILCFLVALYAFAIFGYVTATLASVLTGHEVKGNAPGVDVELFRELRAEIATLNERLKTATS
jgi:voltage-gated potassium channel